MERTTIKTIAFGALTAGILAATQGVWAHTRLQTPVTTEGARVYNASVIGHGCENPAGGDNLPVIAHSTVFPDGIDSTITVNGAVVDGAEVTDYVENWGGQMSYIPSRDVFSQGRAVKDPNGNVVGVQAWHGSLPGDQAVGLVPFRVSALVINEASCAQSVTFRVAAADICKLTKISGFNDNTVNLWIPAVGSKFDGLGINADGSNAHGYNSPATYKITRTSALPAECAAAEDVVIDPSAAQLNRNLPIPGIWPRR